MSFFAGLLAASGAFAVAVSLAHSIIGERLIFARPNPATETGIDLGQPMFARLFRIFWHFPSLAWSGFGLVPVVMHLLGYDPSNLTWGIAVFFGLSGAANLFATRQAHPGGLLLIAIAGLFLLSMMVARP
jgi:hypothetical protein